MRNLYLSFFLLIFSFSAVAQNDPAAKKVIEAFGSKVKASNGISAAFTLSSLTSKGRSTGSKALTLSMRGEKYFLKQGKTEIICDGKNIYNFDGAKTITKSSVEESAQTLSPQKLLAGSYDKDFTYKLVSSAGSTNEIELKPIDNRKNFQKVNLFFDKTKSVLTKARILDKSNNITQLKVNSINLNANLADVLFVFNPKKYPKDAEIID